MGMYAPRGRAYGFGMFHCSGCGKKFERWHNARKCYCGSWGLAYIRPTEAIKRRTCPACKGRGLIGR